MESKGELLKFCLFKRLAKDCFKLTDKEMKEVADKHADWMKHWNPLSKYNIRW